MKHIISLAILLASAAAQAATPYTATPFVVPGATNSMLYDINNSGTLAGFATLGSGNNQGFTYSAGAFTWLTGPAGSLNTLALGLSDGGTVVGSYSDTLVDDGSGSMVLGPNKGFIFEGGSYSTFTLAGYTETVIRAISPNGRFVTGYATNDTGFAGWIHDRLSATTDIITTGNVVIAQGVTDAGLVVGSRFWQVAPGNPLQRQSFQWQGGVYTGFQLDGQTDTRARAITDSGFLTGWVRNGSDIRAFFGSQTDYSTAQWGSLQTYAEGINNAGVAVGGYFLDDASGNSVALIFNPVPEPGTYALMLGGLGLLALRARRQA